MILVRRLPLIARVLMGTPDLGFYQEPQLDVELAPVRCGTAGWIDVTFFDRAAAIEKCLFFAFITCEEACAVIDGEIVESVGFTLRRRVGDLIAIEFRPYVEEFAPFPSTWWISVDDLKKAVLQCI